MDTFEYFKQVESSDRVREFLKQVSREVEVGKGGAAGDFWRHPLDPILRGISWRAKDLCSFAVIR